MLVSDIFTRVQRTFGDEANSQITSSDIIRWINDGQREIALANELFQTVATASVVAGQAQYSLPPDRMKILAVQVDDYVLSSYSFSEAQQQLSGLDNSTSSVPVGYFIFANELNIFPTPGGSANTIIVFYNRTPVDVTQLSDTPEIPVQYHSRLVEYCMAQAYELDDNVEAAQYKQTQFQNGVTKLKDSDLAAQDYYPFIGGFPSDAEDVYPWVSGWN